MSASHTAISRKDRPIHHIFEPAQELTSARIRFSVRPLSPPAPIPVTNRFQTVRSAWPMWPSSGILMIVCPVCATAITRNDPPIHHVSFGIEKLSWARIAFSIQPRHPPPPLTITNRFLIVRSTWPMWPISETFQIGSPETSQRLRRIIGSDGLMVLDRPSPRSEDRAIHHLPRRVPKHTSARICFSVPPPHPSRSHSRY